MYFATLLITLALTCLSLASPIRLSSSSPSRRHASGASLSLSKRADSGSSLATYSLELTPRNETQSPSVIARTSIQDLVDSVKGKGSAESVKLTWYSGSGLLNPSCWAQAVWQPTDSSYVCALTLDGWLNKPECLSFLQLCNGAKCVSCRVVDTCAGCVGKQVDVSQAVFRALAPLSQGVITDVKMSTASDPSQWDKALWGPKTA